MPAAALEQLLLRYRLAIASADAYARAGFVAIVQDVIVGPLLQEVADMIDTTPRYLVVLDPEPDAIEAREARRAKSGYGQGWEPAGLVAEMRQTTPRLGLWLDTTAQVAPDTVQMILSRLPEALIDPAARVP